MNTNNVKEFSFDLLISLLFFSLEQLFFEFILIGPKLSCSYSIIHVICSLKSPSSHVIPEKRGLPESAIKIRPKTGKLVLH